MRVPLSLSLLFLAVSSCFSSGSETDRYPRRRNARTKKQNHRKHIVSRNKKNFVLAHPFYYYHRRYYYYYYRSTMVHTLFHVDKISSLLAYWLYFFDFFVKTPSKKKSRSTRVRVTHNTRAHSRASAPTPKQITRIIVLLNKRKTWACVLFARARVYI